jgi:hypothetical protein
LLAGVSGWRMEMDRIGWKDAVEMGWDGMDAYNDGI